MTAHSDSQRDRNHVRVPKHLVSLDRSCTAVGRSSPSRCSLQPRRAEALRLPQHRSLQEPGQHEGKNRDNHRLHLGNRQGDRQGFGQAWRESHHGLPKRRERPET